MTVLFNLFTELFCAKTVVFCGNWKNCERGLRWSVHRRKPTLSPHQGPVPGDQFSMMWNIKDCTTFLLLTSAFCYPVCFVVKCKHAEMHSPWHSKVSVYYHTTDATMHSDSERRMVWTPDQALVKSCKSLRSSTLSCCWSFPTKMTVSDANHIDILRCFCALQSEMKIILFQFGSLAVFKNWKFYCTMQRTARTRNKLFFEVNNGPIYEDAIYHCTPWL